MHIANYTAFMMHTVIMILYLFACHVYVVSYVYVIANSQSTVDGTSRVTFHNCQAKYGGSVAVHHSSYVVVQNAMKV